MLQALWYSTTEITWSHIRDRHAYLNSHAKSNYISKNSITMHYVFRDNNLETWNNSDAQTCCSWIVTLNWRIASGIGRSWAAVASERKCGLQGFFARKLSSWSPGFLCQGFRPSSSVHFRGWSLAIYSDYDDLMGSEWSPEILIFASFARRRNCSPSEQASLGFYWIWCFAGASVITKGSLGEGIARLASRPVWAIFWIGPLVSWAFVLLRSVPCRISWSASRNIWQD
jgi:hypothetical protein